MKTTVFMLLMAVTVGADEVRLTSGRVVSGKVEDLGDKIRVSRGGASVVYPKFMVKEIVARQTDEDVYAGKSKALAKDDLKGHLALARWCRKHKLHQEARGEFQKVIALDGDHEEARSALGHRRHEGKWMTSEEYNQAKGLVRFRGRWITPEERDVILAREEQKKLDAALVRRVKQLLSHTRYKDGKKRQAAIDGLDRIDDEYKVKAYVRAISSGYERTRRYVYGELARMKEPSATRPLVNRSLGDPVEELREVAFDAIKQIDHPETALFFAPYLGNGSVHIRMLAVRSMATFGDLRTIGPLLQAFEAAHNRINPPQNSINAQQDIRIVNRTIVTSDGRRLVLPRVRRIRRQPVIDPKLFEERNLIVGTLRALTGEDFGDTPAGWRKGLARRKPR